MALRPYTKEWLEELCSESFSYAEVLRKAGRKPAGGSQATLKKKIEEYNIDISHFTGELWSKGKTAKDDERIKKMASNLEKYTDETIFQVGSASRRVVRAYILRHNSIPYECKTCGNKGEWFGKIMPLELHHINGVNNDNRLKNLCFLCPNCHSITENYCGRNITSKKEEKPKKIIVIPKKKKYCIDCGKEISSKADRCKSCAAILSNSKNSKRPEREELKKLIRDLPFTKIGEQYGVSDNAVKKWCDFYGLPRKKSNIKLYSDDEWNSL